MEDTELLKYNFSDLYINSNKDFYISDERYLNSLRKVTPTDKDKFYKKVVNTEHQERSYSIKYRGTSFRVENVVSTNGEIYCLRRMPLQVPSIHNLGFDNRFVQYMLSLASYSGLILWAGSTGNGKTTSISALLSEYLKLNGGFAYTIEDPAEMPLEGEYTALNGSVGLCKQIEVQNDKWGDALKSALRSHPRYILIGEIRTPDAAHECLRAAISGHLVLSTIHSGSISSAISSLVKYASYYMSEASAYDILSRGLLSIIYQNLDGLETKRKPEIEALFANPEVNQACQVRSTIRNGNLNLATSIEAQAIRMQQGKKLF